MADFTVTEQGALRPFQDPQAVVDFLQTVPDGFVACRAGRRHDWKPSTAIENKRYRYWTIWERCSNCHSERWCERSARTFALTKDWEIVYVEGYLAPAGSGPIAGQAHDLVYREHIKRNFTSVRTTTKAELPRGIHTRAEVEADEPETNNVRDIRSADSAAS